MNTSGKKSSGTSEALFCNFLEIVSKLTFKNYLQILLSPNLKYFLTFKLRILTISARKYESLKINGPN